LPSFLSSHPSLSIPALDAFQLQLTPFNSTPTSFQAPGAKMLLIGVAYDASSRHSSNGSSPDVTAGAAEEGEQRKTSENEPFFLGGPPYSLTAAEVRALYEPRGVDVVEILASEERVESAPPRLRERGVTSMIETTYLLRKRRHAEEKRKRRRSGGRGLIGG
jgi:hypothetical protein